MSLKRIIPMVFLVLGFIVYAGYFLKTNWNEHTYDARGHISHVKLMSNTLRPPPSSACWQCYHPPVYYASAALFMKMVGAKDDESMGRSLQLFSVFLFTLFLYFGVKCLLYSEVKFPLLAIAFFIFWPSGIINSVRVGNDNAFYLFYSISLFLLLKWDPRVSHRNFYGAAFFACASLLTKANGFISVALVGAVAVWKIFRSSKREKIMRALSYGAAILSYGVGLFIFIVWFKGNMKTNTIGLPAKMYMGNSWDSYFGFDFHQYFRPFLDVTTEGTGRHFVWIFLLKTSLFGEFFSESKIALLLAPTVNFLLLPILAISLLGALRSWGHENRMILLMSVTLSVAALVAYRWACPYYCAGDFRYIYPILISAAVFFSDGIEVFQKRDWKIAEIGGMMVLGIFLVAATSIVFVF